MFLKKLLFYSNNSLSKYVLGSIGTNNLRNYMTNSILPYKKLTMKPDWNYAVSEGEKLVGFSNSLWNLNCLNGDDMATYITLRLEKFGDDTPSFSKTADYFLFNDKDNMLAWGLIVLLYSKATEQTFSTVTDMEKRNYILSAQRSLAEITEMIKISRLFHQALINLNPVTEHEENVATRNDILSWNKVALLSGDFLLAKALSELAKLRNQRLNELLSLTGRDFAESQFLGDRDTQNKPLPTNPTKILTDNFMGQPEKEWTLRNTLTDGSLLGACCRSAMMVAGGSEHSQKQAHLFGKHLALAWQASHDLDIFQSQHEEGNAFSLVCAPVLYHMEQDVSLYGEIEKGRLSVDNVNFTKIHDRVKNGPGLEKTTELYLKHKSVVEKNLTELPLSEARTSLENIISLMR